MHRPVVLLAAILGVPFMFVAAACSSSTEQGSGTSGASGSAAVPRPTCSGGAELVCNGDGDPSNRNTQCQCLVRCTFGQPGPCKSDECCSSIQDSTFNWCSPVSRNGVGVTCEPGFDAGLDAKPD